MRSTLGRRLGGVIAAAAAAALILSGCTGQTTGTDATQDAKLNLALSTDRGTFDPALQVSAGDTTWFWHTVYDTLLTCNADGTVTPNAAESYQFNDTSTELTLALRDGMTFSDGSPVDSAAVKASIEHIKTGGGSDASRVADVTVTTPDDLTVVLTTTKPTGLLPTFMCLAPGIIASPASLTSSDLDTNPVSSGPYTYDAANSTNGSVYTFVKRSDYWNAAAYPYETVVLTVMDDVTARLNALKTGQIDGATLNDATQAEAAGSGIKVWAQEVGFAGLIIGDRNGTLVPALGDARVRQAINMVFDRPAIAKGLFNGEATPGTQVFVNNDATVPELDDLYPFDIEAAKALMTEAGYADGFSMEIPAISGFTEQANPLIIQQLSELNIAVTEVPITLPDGIGDMLGGRFPAMYFPLASASGLWDVVEKIQPDAIWNFNRASDPALTELTTKAQVLQGDEAKANLEEINRYVVENAWFAPFVYNRSYFGTAKEDTISGIDDYFKQTPSLSSFK